METVYKKNLAVYEKETNLDKEAFWKRVSQELATLQDSSLHTEVNSKFVPYPSTNDSDYNQKIYRKKEFQKNKYMKPTLPYDEVASQKCASQSFLLTENQRFLKNFISPDTPYNSILLYHSVGTGKTCTAISIAEQFSNVFNKKHLVLVSPNIKDNFKKQIFDASKLVISQNQEIKSNQCTNMKYVNMIPEILTLNEEAIEKKAKKLVNDRYQFKGYMELSNDYDRDYMKVFGKDSISNEKKASLFDMVLKEKYSNRVIIIDEVHNLRSSMTESEHKVLPYKLERILRIAENVKLILLTATPMFNDVSEITWLVNIMLLNDKKPLLNNDIFDKEGNITKEGEKRLIEATKGRVSYLKGENPYSFPLRLYPNMVEDDAVLSLQEVPSIDIFGKLINDSHRLDDSLCLVKSSMSPYQKRVYDVVQSMFKQHQTNLEKQEREVVANSQSPPSDETPSSSTPNSQTSRNTRSSSSSRTPTNRQRPDIQMALQVSNIVFPHDEKEDIEDIREYYGYNKSTKGVIRGFNRCFKSNDRGNTTFFSYKDGVEEFLAYDSLSQYSAKMKSIVDYILNAEGIVFVYSAFLYSGILPLAMALEHVGFEKYDGNNLLPDMTKKNKITPTPKYILLSANSQFSSNNDKEINVAKHPNNQDGSMVKVILGSSIATEGIDFKNIREIHILEPWYHLQKQEQIIGRGARHCSHQSLPLSKRNVMIYQHVNTKNASTKKETIDLRVCRIAVNKQQKIDKVADVLRSNAVDCALNLFANKHDKSTVNKIIDISTSQGRIIKDYPLGDRNDKTVSCIMQKNNSINTNVNTSTFSSKHLEDHIPPYIDAIRNAYKDKIVMMSFEKLEESLKQYMHFVDREVLINALELMLKDKIIITKENGQQKGYIIYKGNKYIWQPLNKENEKISLEERVMESTNKTSSLQKKLNFTKFVARPEKSQYDIEDFMKKIEQRIKELKTAVKSLRVPASLESKMNDVIVDYVVDRLSEKEFLTLLMNFSNVKNRTSTTKRALWDSIERSGILYNIDGKFVFRNLFDTKDKKKEPVFVSLKIDKTVEEQNTKNSKSNDASNKTSVKLIPVVIQKEEAEKLEKVLKKNIMTQKPDLQGFLVYEKNTVNFKTISTKAEGEKNRSSGSVCLQNPKLSVDALQSMINERGINLVDSKYKYKKDEMCEMFEITLRLYSPEQFARPYEYFLIRKK